jgi:hypothetical protein
VFACKCYQFQPPRYCTWCSWLCFICVVYVTTSLVFLFKWYHIEIWRKMYFTICGGNAIIVLGMGDSLKHTVLLLITVDWVACGCVGVIYLPGNVSVSFSCVVQKASRLNDVCCLCQYNNWWDCSLYRLEITITLASLSIHKLFLVKYWGANCIYFPIQNNTFANYFCHTNNQTVTCFAVETLFYIWLSLLYLHYIHTIT